MEPAQKKAKITGHFRVALKPQDINVQRANKKFKKHLDIDKENVEVITIGSDDEEDDLNTFNKRQIASQQPEVLAVRQQPVLHPTDKSQSNKNTAKRKSHQASIVDVTDDEEEADDEDFTIHQPKQINRYTSPLGLPSYVKDHDRQMLDDLYSEPYYAWDSFKYDRERELLFRTRDYLGDDNNRITPKIRAQLVNWLCKLQDYFSLYHESLYMAVKIADQYLMKKTIPKGELQLLYLTSIFISMKYDERQAPVEIEQLLRQVGRTRTGRWVYNRSQVISTEVDILCTLQFDIRFPLSYGFLRRYARCTLTGQPELTVTLFLARYILESSLLDHKMIEILESKVAAAAFLLALRMRNLDDVWDKTAEYYIGYKQEELEELATQLNNVITEPTHILPTGVISYVKRKYSDDTYKSVASIPTLTMR